MELKELQDIGFRRIEMERDYLHKLECEALEDMNESQREWNHACIMEKKARIQGMIIMLYTLGAYPLTERNEKLWKE